MHTYRRRLSGEDGDVALYEVVFVSNSGVDHHIAAFDNVADATALVSHLNGGAAVVKGVIKGMAEGPQTAAEITAASEAEAAEAKAKEEAKAAAKAAKVAKPKKAKAGKPSKRRQHKS